MTNARCLRCGAWEDLVPDPHHPSLCFCHECIEAIRELARAIDGTDPDEPWM